MSINSCVARTVAQTVPKGMTAKQLHSSIFLMRIKWLPWRRWPNAARWHTLSCSEFASALLCSICVASVFVDALPNGDTFSSVVLPTQVVLGLQCSRHPTTPNRFGCCKEGLFGDTFALLDFHWQPPQQ